MSAAEMFWAAPPISRTITAATVLLSVPAHMHLLVEFYWIVFIKENILTFRQLPEIWRLATTFLITGPRLNLILDPYFLWTYSSALETTSPNMSGPGDFFVYMVFVCCVILLLGGFYLSGAVLQSALTLALAYTYAQENPNRQINYIIITFSAKWLPYVMLLMTLVMTASLEATVIEATGLVAAHLFQFLTQIWPQHGGTGRKFINTPLFVQRWFAEPSRTPLQRGAGTAFRTTPTNVSGAQTGSGGGWSSGSNWNERGTGRRLGGS